MNLTVGWNLISFPVEEPELNNMKVTKASDMFNITNCTELAIWNANSQNYTIYIPGFNLPTDPENFDIGEDDSLFIWMVVNQSYLVEGYKPSNRYVSLKTGWNMIAYKNLVAKDVMIWANQITAGPFDDICYYDNETFIHYIFPGTEMMLMSGRGYFVWSDIDTWLIY